MTDSRQERVLREQAFHDARFAEEVRGREEKFYYALQIAFDRYWQLVDERASGCDVLEYGCAHGDNAMRLAATARSLLGIDISPVAIAQADEKARAANITNAQFAAMNAEAMDIPDASFDFVFGSGILHHLDLSLSLAELRRVLRPGGSCVFMEPLGHNAIINMYRRMTPASRTADEHPLLRRDFDLARRFFTSVETEFYGLSQLAAVPFRGTPLHGLTAAASRAIDNVLLSWPVVKWHAWTVIVTLGTESAL